MIDINLTGSIATNLAQPQPWFDPANWLPIIVVTIGAFFTYFFAIRLEDRRNRYNLKVKMYLEILDQIQLLKMYKDDIATLTEHLPDEDEDKKQWVGKEIIDKCKKTAELHNSLFQHVAKCLIISNENVMKYLNDFYQYSNESEIDTKTFTIKLFNLTKAMRKDLGAKGKELDWLKVEEEAKKKG